MILKLVFRAKLPVIQAQVLQYWQKNPKGVSFKSLGKLKGENEKAIKTIFLR